MMEKSLLNRLSMADLDEIFDLQNLEPVTMLTRGRAGIKNNFNVLADKEILCEILKDMLSPEDLMKSQTRRKFFSVLSKDQKNHLAKGTGINPDRLFEEIGWGNNQQTALFLEVVGLPSSLIPNPQTNYQPTENVSVFTPRFKQLKDYQSKVIFKVLDVLDSPRARVMICMPTGSGKTRTAMEIVCNQLNKNDRKSVLWLVDSQELMLQAAECFKQIWSHLGARDINIQMFGYGFGQEPDVTTGSFIIASMQTLVRKLNVCKDMASNIGLIAFDEAHHAIATSYKNVVEILTPVTEETRVLGLSATPVRKDADEDRELCSMFHNNIMEIEAGADQLSTLESLIRKQILARPIWKALDYDTSGLTFSPQQIKAAAKKVDIAPAVLEKIANDYNRNRCLVDCLAELARKEIQTIFFSATVKQSFVLSSALKCLGIKADHIDSNSKSMHRTNVIRAFKEKRVQILCNYGVLTTGFDDPNIGAVVIGRPTFSEVLLSQMIGRGLRGPELGGSPICYIYLPEDNFEFTKKVVQIKDYFTNSWNKNREI